MDRGASVIARLKNKAKETGKPFQLHLQLFCQEEYSRLTDGVESALDEADKAAMEDDRRYTHEEVFANLRRRVNG